MIRKTLGGDRLGAGKKMQVDMKGYDRSTHDLSRIFRSSAAAGTLIPVYNKLILPGDTWDINLQVNIMTHPTLGPLFGSYAVEVHAFETPIRLYNSWLHNNKLKIGQTMADIKLPQVTIPAVVDNTQIAENSQIEPSALFKYLGISGVGVPGEGWSQGDVMTRKFNAIPYLAYWDIFKNYYSNKQEENAYVVHNGSTAELQPTLVQHKRGSTLTTIPQNSGDSGIILTVGDSIVLTYANPPGTDQIDYYEDGFLSIRVGTDEYNMYELFPNGPTISGDTLTFIDDDPTHNGLHLLYWDAPATEQYLALKPFPLTNLDEMRENILATAGNVAYTIDQTSLAPYSYPMENISTTDTPQYAMTGSQEGLAVKTYKSDLFNNWIETETQEYISGISAIDTSTGSFTIDTLNLAEKIYNLNNRIAVSGGTYDDWIETVYDNGVFRKAETPMYMGGLIKELAFQEIVSTATTSTDAGGDQPLGHIAGKGTMTKKHHGGQVQIKPREPGYLTIIFSLTPRIDYSQGNEWDINLKTLDDLHKPELDEIGFQDLITEQMHWAGTTVNSDGSLTMHSAGKQPAWMNYMTDVNKTFGNFAIEENEMFMTLNRRYETSKSENNIKDITTYIDPTKYNFIFAETDLSAQNFWVQVGIDATVRRKMSAKIIPNL